MNIRKQPTVLVTGAGTRIGAAIARRLAADGMSVLIHYNSSQNEAEQLQHQLQTDGHQAFAIQANLTDKAQLDGLIDAATNLVGRPIDFLVNNASLFPKQHWRDATRDDLGSMIDIHVWAPIVLTRNLARQGGRAVVNIVDARIGGLDLNHGPYIASKQLLANVGRQLAAELAPMRINSVAPGPILPPSTGSPTGMAKAVKESLLQRAGTPENVASAVAYLLENDYVTGTTAYVDGGASLGFKD